MTIPSAAISAVVEEISRNAQSIMGNRLRKIILYGSYARGDYKDYSDLDIMVLGNFNENEHRVFESEIDKVASDIGLDNDIIVSVMLNEESLFMRRLHISPFYRNVLSEGVEIYGTR
ncbi:MAG: nucleotidyltransferase domain-containing protein [Defluviitaleaceae bacterium]|nr:nucleotidyltransferase domain-containing protein [Defluviitaleaceae bacterium]MCL2276166.1 nucleotidyltransferase domain-containing protein [Defluviitaleaceae bacterium]